jgi:hypothetical protein
MDAKQKKLMVIVCAVFAIGLIALTIFSMIGKKTHDDDADITIAKIHDISPKSPYLTICFSGAVKKDGISVDTSGLFELKIASFNDKCVDFLINNGDGIANSGKYDIFLSATALNDTKINKGKATVNVVDSLGTNSEAANKQNEAANRNNDVKLNDSRQSDPIYAFLSNPHKAEHFSIAEQIDKNGKIVLVIHINMAEPVRPGDRVVAETYKNEALDTIRSWGFNPDNYNINIEYDR